MATDSRSLPPIVQQWLRVWTEDPGQVAELYAPKARYEDLPGGVTLHGPEAIRGHIAEERAAFPEQRITVRSAVAAGDRAAFELVFTGAYTGTLLGVPPGSGQLVVLPLAVFLEVSGDRIWHETHYYDATTLLGQMTAPR